MSSAKIDELWDIDVCIEVPNMDLSNYLKGTDSKTSIAMVIRVMFLRIRRPQEKSLLFACLSPRTQ